MFGVKRNRKLAVLLSLAMVVELFAISPNTASANVSKEPAETVSTGFIEDSQEAPLAFRLEDSFWGTTRYDAPSDVPDEPLVITLEDSFADEAVYDDLFSQSANSLLGSAPTSKLTISNSSRNYTYKAQSDNFTVSGVKGSLSYEYTWLPSGQNGWARCIYNGSSIKVTIDKNPKTSSRKVIIKVTDSQSKESAIITITQDAGPKPPPTNTPVPTKKPNTPTKKPNTNTPTPYLSLASSTRDYGYQATSDTITVKGRQGSLTFEYSWSPSTQTDWARLIFDGSSIKVTIDENKTTEARSVTVKIIDSKTKKSASIKLNQAAGPSRPDSPTPSNGPKPSNSPTPTNKPGGSPTPTPFLTVSSPTRSYSYTSTTDTITVNGCQGSLQYDFSWTPSTVTGWAHLVYDGKSIKLTLDANPSATSRSVNVKITDSKTTKTATLTINQAGAPPKPTDPPTPTPFLSISQASRSYAHKGTTDTVSIKGVQGTLRYEYTWNSTAKDWVHLIYDGTSIKLTLNANNSVASRSVSIKIIDSKTNKTATLSISQAGAPPTPTPFLTINNSATRTYPYQATSDTITLSGVQGTLEYAFDWFPSGEPGWAHLIYDGQKIKMTLDANKEYYLRRVSVRITDTKTKKTATLTIEQEGAPRPEPTPTPYLKINNSSTRSFDYHSATDTVTVSGAKAALKFEFKWYPATEKDWVHIIYDGKTVKLTIDENKATTERYAVIKLRDSQTLQFAPLTIQQEGAPREEKSLSVNQPSRTYKCEKATDTFTLTGAHGALKFEYSWKPATPTDWARFIYDGQSIKLTLDENKTTSPRTAYVKFIDTTTNKYINVTIEQEGKPKPVTVEFVVKDKHGEEINAYTRAYLESGQAYGDVFPQVRSPKGWHIAAWKDESGNYINKYSIVPSKDMVTLTPVWIEKDKYLIIFDGNGALYGSMKPMTCVYGKKYTLHEVGFDDGFGFDCWGTTPFGDKETLYPTRATCLISNIPRLVSGALANTANPTYLLDTAKIILNDRSIGSITLYAFWYENKRASYFDPIKATPIGNDRLTHIYKIKDVDEYPEVILDGLTFLGWSRSSSSFLETPEFRPGDTTVTDGENWNMYPVYKLTKKDSYPIFFYDPMHDVTVTDYVSKGQTEITMPSSPFYEEQYDLLWTTQRTKDIPDPFSSWAPGEKMPITDEFFEYTSPVLIAYWGFQSEKLILNYNYDNKWDEVTVTEDNYTLPSPERTGYVFRGWSRDNQDVDFPDGSSYHIPKNGEELFALWEPKHFTIEFHDGISGALLEVDDDVTVEDYIKKYPSNRASVPGIRFIGWTTQNLSNVPKDKLPWLYRENNEFIALPLIEYGYTASKLPYDQGTVKLYSVYGLRDNANHGEVLIVYLPNGGKTAPTPSRYKKSDAFKITSDQMNRDGYIFDGWELLNLYSGNTAKLYSSGSTLDYPSSGGETIFLLAHWTATSKIHLNVGIDGYNEIDLSKEYGGGDLIKAKTLEDKLPSHSGYHLISWEVITEDEVKYYGINEYITVPNDDVTIKAVWAKDGFYIYYHSGFDEALVKQVYVEGTLDSTYFDKKDYKWIDVEGFTFIGWTAKNPSGRPWGSSSNKIITWSDNNPPVFPAGDLNLYSYYREDNPLKPGYKRLIYINDGGIGGPGVQDVNPAQKGSLISDVAPYKDGYEFDRWLINVNGSFLPVAEDVIRKSQDNIVYLKARWKAQNQNSGLRKELQDRYGKDIMRDYYFESDYESNEWQKINDFCYFVISTKNDSKSEHYTNYKTTALIVQWKNGKWVLEGGSASHNLITIAEYELMTRLPDGYGFMAKTALKGGLTALEHVPYAKWVVYALEIEGVIADIVDECGKGDALDKAATRIASKLADKAFNQFLKATGSSDTAYKMLKQLQPRLKDWTYDSLVSNREDLIRNLKMLGAIGNCTKILYEKRIADVQDAFRNLNYAVKVDFLEYESLAALTDIPKIPDWGFDLLEFFWDTAIDTIEYTGNKKALDPFGTHSDALVTFQNEITKHGFSVGIQKAFPETINNIYAAYYGLN